MGETPYSNLKNRFYNKIKDDKKFFIYKGLSDLEAKEIMDKRANYLLEDALLEFELKVTPVHKITFLDKDDELGVFNFKLTLIEEDLITDLMVAKYYQEQLAGVNKKQEFVGEQGKTLFSLSTERTSLIKLISFVYDKFENKLDEYNGKDRLTGAFLNLDSIGVYADE